MPKPHTAEQYFEVDSYYRNRIEYPAPGEFAVRYSSSGDNNRFNANDPISLAEPIVTPFSSIFDISTNENYINGTIISADPTTPVSSLGNITSPTTLVFLFTTNGYRTLGNFYTGSMLLITNSLGNLERQRITSYGVVFFVLPPNNTPVAIINVEAPFSNYAIMNGMSATIASSTYIPPYGTGTQCLVFIPSGSIYDNFYINYYITDETTGVTGVVTYYDGNLKLATVDRTLSSPTRNWIIYDTLYLRKELPIDNGSQIIGVNTTTTINLATTSSNIQNFYVGSFIRFVSGDNYNDPTRRITSYNNITKVITVYPPYLFTPLADDFYQIEQFSYDNDQPFTFTGSLITSACCYKIELIYIIVPNAVLIVGNGKRLPYYPYIYVQLENIQSESGENRNIILSNNPHSLKMMFRATISDTNYPQTSNYLRFKGDSMTQTVKFKLFDNILFSARLYTGEIITTYISENPPPQPPNPDTQISAVFKLTRI